MVSVEDFGEVDGILRTTGCVDPDEALEGNPPEEIAVGECLDEFNADWLTYYSGLLEFNITVKNTHHNFPFSTNLLSHTMNRFVNSVCFQEISGESCLCDEDYCGNGAGSVGQLPALAMLVAGLLAYLLKL